MVRAPCRRNQAERARSVLRSGVSLARQVENMTHVRSGVRGVCTVMFLCLRAALLVGQTPSPPTDSSTLHVISDMIQVPVLALRPPFRPALGLQPGDFNVSLDNGPSFHPRHALVEGREPLALSFVVEADGSEGDLLSKALQAAVKQWPADFLDDSDRLSVHIYGCQLLRSLHDGPADLTNRRADVVQSVSPPAFRAALQGGRACSRPATADVLNAAIDEIARAPGWRVVVLLLNGERKFILRGKHKMDLGALQGVQAFAAAEGVTLFAIKYLSEGSFPASVYSETEPINMLAGSLGGLTLASSFADLGPVTETILEQVRQRYVLSFPRPSNGSAGVHRLAITSTIKNVQILSSATSAAPFDSSFCTGLGNAWLCPQDRPRYGPLDAASKSH